VRSSFVRVIGLGVAVVATASLSQGTVERVTSQGTRESWEALQRSIGCRGEGPETCARHLKLELAAELRKKPLAMASNIGCEFTRKPHCGVTFDGCLPKAGLFLAELQTLGQAGSVAATEVIQAYNASPWLQPLAFRCLASWKRPEAVDIAKGLLTNPSVECRWEGIDALRKMGPVAVPEVVKAFDEGDWKDRAMLADVLATWRIPEAVEPLRNALRHPPSLAQAAAAMGLAKLGPLAKEALPELRHLADSHWSPDVRNAAAEAASALGRDKVLPRTQHGPPKSLKQAGDKWEVTLGGHPLALVSINRDSEAHGPRVGGACADAADPTPLGHFEEAQGSCFKLVNRGEWGGQLLVEEAGWWESLRETWYLNPYRMVTARGQLYILEGMEHMGTEGGVSKLLRSADGKWHAEPVEQLPGAPKAFGFDADGNLLIVTANGSLNRRPSDCSPEHFLLRLRADGQIEAVE
jgi:hypothetical protein